MFRYFCTPTTPMSIGCAILDSLSPNLGTTLQFLNWTDRWLWSEIHLLARMQSSYIFWRFWEGLKWKLNCRLRLPQWLVPYACPQRTSGKLPFPTIHISHDQYSFDDLHLHHHQAGPWHPGNGGGLGSTGRPRGSSPLVHPPGCHSPRLDQVDVTILIILAIMTIMTIFARDECIAEPGASPPSSDQLCAGLSHARWSWSLWWLQCW